MNVTIELSSDFASFLEAILTLCLGLSAFIAGASLAKKHLQKYLIDEDEFEFNNNSK